MKDAEEIDVTEIEETKTSKTCTVPNFPFLKKQ